MSHPVTIFTGQWADLPLAELAPKIASFGYDGLELACWGDHMDVFKAAENKNYCKAQLNILKKLAQFRGPMQVWLQYKRNRSVRLLHSP